MLAHDERRDYRQAETYDEITNGATGQVMEKLVPSYNSTIDTVIIYAMALLQRRKKSKEKYLLPTAILRSA